MSKKTRGSSLAEYGLVVGLIVVMAIGAIFATGDRVSNIYCAAAAAVALETGAGCEIAAANPGEEGPGAPGGETGGTLPPDAAEELGFARGGIVLEFEANTVTLYVQPGAEGATLNWTDQDAVQITSAGTYSFTYPNTEPRLIAIEGSVVTFQANGDALTRVVSFGDAGLQNLNNSFVAAANLAEVAQLPATVTSLDGTFKGGANGQGANPAGIETWDTSNVGSMQSTFRGNRDFTRDLSAWDVTNVGAANMTNMFYASNYPGNLSSWCVEHIDNAPVNFGLTAAGRAPDWGSCGAGTPEPESDDLLLTVAVAGGSVASLNIVALEPGTIDWGNGQQTAFTAGSTTTGHTYAAPGVYQVVVDGQISSFRLLSANFTSVDAWGSSPLTSLAASFRDVTSLTRVPRTLPPTVTSLNDAFRAANTTGTNPTGVETWDTANVTDMRGAFYGNTVFTRDVSGWNVSNVSSANMANMFAFSNYPGDISSWCVDHISTAPSSFGVATPGKSPVWGFCGAPEPGTSSDALLLTAAPTSATSLQASISLTATQPVVVHWGDGTVSSIPTGTTTLTRTYGGTGSYQVQVDGQISTFKLMNNGWSSVDGWGTSPITSLADSFVNLPALASVPANLPSTVTTLFQTFRRTSALGANPTGVETWDTSSVTDMRNAFSGNIHFARDISGWNVSNVSRTNMAGMFSSANYTGNLNTWCVDHIATAPSGFGVAETGKAPVWGFCGVPVLGSNSDALLLTSAPSSATSLNANITLTTTAPSVIHWGDGTATSAPVGTFTYSHPYNAAGSYPVQIDGQISAFRFANDGWSAINSWGTQPLTTLERAFLNSPSVASVPGTIPSTVTSLLETFRRNSSTGANPTGVETWNTANVTDMRSAFAFNTSFSRDVSGWDVTNVSRTNMAGMFNGANYPGDLTSWCVSHIASAPSSFGVNAARDPIWGTCP